MRPGPIWPSWSAADPGRHALGTLGGDLDRMTRVLHRQEDLVERWTAAGGPSFDGRARALLLELGLEDEDVVKPTRILSAAGELVSLAACSPANPTYCCSTSPRPTSTSTRANGSRS